MGETLAAVTGFSSGFIVAGGVVALMVGLGIITRFIGISHTAAHIRAGENAILFGTVVGTILTVYEVSLPFGSWVLAIAGVFMGTFVGGWIMAPLCSFFFLLSSRFHLHFFPLFFLISALPLFPIP